MPLGLGIHGYDAGRFPGVISDHRQMLAALAAHDAEQALPLKERPDFMAGYVAGLADGRRCAERDAAEQAAYACMEAAHAHAA